MKFCEQHWAALRASVESRGMTHLVAKDGHQAIENLRLEAEGRAREAHFDPLMTAHNMIVGEAMSLLGLAMFVGEVCPVCEVLRDYPPIPAGHRYQSNESYWIDGPVDACLEMARARGVMPSTPPTSEASRGE